MSDELDVTLQEQLDKADEQIYDLQTEVESLREQLSAAKASRQNLPYRDQSGDEMILKAFAREFADRWATLLVKNHPRINDTFRRGAEYLGECIMQNYNFRFDSGVIDRMYDGRFREMTAEVVHKDTINYKQHLSDVYRDVQISYYK